MKKLILLIPLMILVATLVSAFPYEIDGGLIKVGNETFTGDTPAINFSLNGVVSVIDGKMSIQRNGADGDGALYVHELINPVTNSINYTIFEGDISVGSSSASGDWILNFMTTNATETLDQYSLAVVLRASDEIKMENWGNNVDTDIIDGWIDDGTTHHLQIVVSDIGAKGTATAFLNGTEKAKITTIECQSGTTYCPPKFAILGSGTWLPTPSVNVSDWVSYNGSVYNVSYEAPPPVDTCTAPGAGDWAIDCSDNCVFDSAQIAPGNIHISGSGNLMFTAPITLSAANAYVAIDSGCTLDIRSGGELS